MYLDSPVPIISITHVVRLEKQSSRDTLPELSITAKFITMFLILVPFEVP